MLHRLKNGYFKKQPARNETKNYLNIYYMSKCDFVGLGFCSNDDLSLLPEIPLDSKVQIITHTIQGGGPAATSTVAAARLGLSAGFIGVVGDDDAGKKILSDFQSEKVCTEAMIVRKTKLPPWPIAG